MLSNGLPMLLGLRGRMAGLYDGEICNPGLRGRGHLFVIRGLSIARANLTGDPPAKAGIRDVSDHVGDGTVPQVGPFVPPGA